MAVAAVLAPPPEQEAVVGRELCLVVGGFGREREFEEEVEAQLLAGDPDLDCRVRLELGEPVVGRGGEERAVVPVGGGGRVQLDRRQLVARQLSVTTRSPISLASWVTQPIACWSCGTVIPRAPTSTGRHSRSGSMTP